MRQNLGFALALIVCGVVAASAQDKPRDSTKTGDAVQSSASPLPVGAGVTLLVGQDGKAVTAGLGRDWFSKGVNFAQVSLTGTVNDQGTTNVISSSDKLAPGFTGKIGIGHSSFSARDYNAWSTQAGKLTAQLWCLSVATAANDMMPGHGPLTPNPDKCDTWIDAVNTRAGNDPANKAVRDAMGVLNDMVGELTKSPQPVAFARLHACAKFDAAQLKDFLPMCGKIPTVEDSRTKFPTLYHQYMDSVSLPDTNFKLSVNWLPQLISIPYRLASNLGAMHTWSHLLNTATVDSSVFHGPFVAGLSVGYGETVEAKLDKVCKNTVEDVYSVQQCKDAMLGAPEPDRAWSFSGAVLMYPISQTAGAFVRSGVQILAKYQLPPKGKGHQSEIDVPFFVVPAAAPFNVSVGIAPKWQWDYTKSRDAIFSVELFVGVRPDLK